MPSLGPMEIVLIILVIAILFGWSKLPDAARSLGRSMRIFKSEVEEMKRDKPSAASHETVPGTTVPPAHPQQPAQPQQAPYVPPPSGQPQPAPYQPPQTAPQQAPYVPPPSGQPQQAPYQPPQAHPADPTAPPAN